MRRFLLEPAGCFPPAHPALAASQAGSATTNTGRWNCGTRPPPLSLVIDAVKPANHGPLRSGRVPKCNVYVRGRPMGARPRGRGILFGGKRQNNILSPHPPPGRAAFWISWVGGGGKTLHVD